MLLSVCTEANFLAVINFVKMVLNILCIIVPIALIIMLAMDITKIVMNPDEKVTSSAMKSIRIRMIAAVALFFVPTMVNTLMTMLGENFIAGTCWRNANRETILMYRSAEEERLTANQVALREQALEANRRREEVLAARQAEQARIEVQEREATKRAREEFAERIKEEARQNAANNSGGMIAVTDSENIAASAGNYSYSIRTSAPTSRDYWYTVYSTNYISQCPWYAISRALEIVNNSSLSPAQKKAKTQSLMTTRGNGKDVANNVKSAHFNKGEVVKAPAIISNNVHGTAYGHVFIIEKVEGNKVTITESSNRNGVKAANNWAAVRWNTKVMTIDELNRYRTGPYVYILE